MFKFIAIIFVGLSLAGWLCTANANAEISQALGNPGPDIIDTIQHWGVQDKFSDDRHKREEMLAEQQRHDAQIQQAATQIKEVNAALPVPLPTIESPEKTP